ncbi:MAG: NUDIX domain-containing protein [Actinocatenispora sp.]
MVDQRGSARERDNADRSDAERRTADRPDAERPNAERSGAAVPLRPARRIGAYGVLTDDAGRILLTRSSDRSDVAGTWYLPGGGIEHGEHPLEAVVREVAEETGLQVEVAGLRTVVADVLEIPARGERLHTDRVLYDVRATGGTLRDEPDGTTDLARWIGREEAAGLPLMPFVADVLGLPATPPQVTAEPPPTGTVPTGTVLAGPTLATPAGAPRGQRFAAYALATDPAGRVLLTRNTPGYPGGGHWHLPGGGTDHGESPAHGVLRELVEETDQVGVVTELAGVFSHRNPAALGPEGYPMDWHAVGVLYRVFVAAPGTPCVMDVGGSTDAADWFTLEQVTDLPITDAVAWALRVTGIDGPASPRVV